MGWNCNVDGVSGSAYTDLTTKRPTSAIIARLEDDDRRWLADVVIFDLGRNDGRVAPDQLSESVRNAYKTASRLWPEAEMVVIAPWFLTAKMDDFTPRQTVLDVIDNYDDFTLIDPNLSDWVTDPRTSRWVIPGNEPHFDQRGHDFVADRLTTMLREANLAEVPVVDAPVELSN